MLRIKYYIELNQLSDTEEIRPLRPKSVGEEKCSEESKEAFGGRYIGGAKEDLDQCMLNLMSSQFSSDDYFCRVVVVHCCCVGRTR